MTFPVSSVQDFSCTYFVIGTTSRLKQERHLVQYDKSKPHFGKPKDRLVYDRKQDAGYYSLDLVSGAPVCVWTLLYFEEIWTEVKNRLGGKWGTMFNRFFSPLLFQIITCTNASIRKMFPYTFSVMLHQFPHGTQEQAGVARHFTNWSDKAAESFFFFSFTKIGNGSHVVKTGPDLLESNHRRETKRPPVCSKAHFPPWKRESNTADASSPPPPLSVNEQTYTVVSHRIRIISVSRNQRYRAELVESGEQEEGRKRGWTPGRQAGRSRAWIFTASCALSIWLHTADRFLPVLMAAL